MGRGARALPQKGLRGAVPKTPRNRSPQRRTVPIPTYPHLPGPRTPASDTVLAGGTRRVAPPPSKDPTEVSEARARLPRGHGGVVGAVEDVGERRHVLGGRVAHPASGHPVHEQGRPGVLAVAATEPHEEPLAEGERTSGLLSRGTVERRQLEGGVETQSRGAKLVPDVGVGERQSARATGQVYLASEKK